MPLRKASVALCSLPEHGNLPCISCIVVRRFQDEGQMANLRVTDDARQGFESDFSLADACVTILAGGADVETVIEMDGMEAGEADYMVKFFKYAVEIVRAR